jgi:2-polyprenyl-3-methyl-5-hydroxy-6-metoxy-1,4-benzoquinol methylase
MTGEKRDFNTAALTWDENPARVKLAGDVARAIRETIPLKPAMDVLDFGCGTGLLTLQLRPLVHSVTGADSAPGMLEVLARKTEAAGLTGVSTMLFDPDREETLRGEYDLIVSSMTFHHIPDIYRIAALLHARLRPGGWIAIADLDCDGGRFHDSNEGVYHLGFDRSLLKKKMESAGFTQVRNRTAAIVHKSAPVCRERSFTVFLMTAKK